MQNNGEMKAMRRRQVGATCNTGLLLMQWCTNAPEKWCTNAPNAVVHQSTRGLVHQRQWCTSNAPEEWCTSNAPEAVVHQCTRGTIVNCLFGEMRSLQAACARKAAPAPAYFDVRNSALEPSHILCI